MVEFGVAPFKIGVFIHQLTKCSLARAKNSESNEKVKWIERDGERRKKKFKTTERRSKNLKRIETSTQYIYEKRNTKCSNLPKKKEIHGLWRHAQNSGHWTFYARDSFYCYANVYWRFLSLSSPLSLSILFLHEYTRVEIEEEVGEKKKKSGCNFLQLLCVVGLCSHSLKIYSMVVFFPFQPNYEHNYLHMKTNGMHVVAVAEQRKKWINSASAGVWCDLGSCTVRNPLEAKTPEKCQINRLFGKLSPSRKSSAKFAISVYFSNHFICACHLNRLAFFYREFVQ